MNETLKIHTQDQGKALVRLQKQGPQVTSIDSGINAIMKSSTASATMTEGIHIAVLALQEKVEKSPDTTSKQLEALQEQIGRLAAQLEVFKSLQSNDRRDTDASKEVTDAEDLPSNPEVLESISRLCQLAHHNAATLHDGEAERVIDDIENMIESMTKHLSHRNSVPPSSRKRYLSEVEGSAIDYRALKRVRGLLIASPSIDINQRSEPPTISRFSSVNTDQSREIL